MGILPIGFFSPLPLAMMIPFMATQSLAMGEAFGKSFQYGKRKISSMSNEEFNKLSYYDLMVEQTANIKALIPELVKQMATSKVMQEAIFREMVELIPTFFESLRPKIETDNTTNTSASPPPPITEIRLGGGQRTTFEASEELKELKRLLEESLKQAGTKEDLELKLNPPPPPPPPYTTPAIKKIASKKVLSASEDPVYLAWISKLGKLKSTYQKQTAVINANPPTELQLRQVGSSSREAADAGRLRNLKAILTNKRRGITSQIRLMSNDYRSPNNHIRENALRLRANMSQWS